MNSYADKTSKNQAVANSWTKQKSYSQSTSQLVNNRPEAIAQRELQQMANNSSQVKQLRALQEAANNSPQVSQLKAFQEMADNYSFKHKHPIQRLQKPVIQRISEEDSRQAIYNIRASVGRHGYTVEGIRNILQHRYSEIQPGHGNRLLIGLGADEGHDNLGSIIYDCYLNRDGTYTIDAFHAHGAQQEGSDRGY